MSDKGLYFNDVCQNIGLRMAKYFEFKCFVVGGTFPIAITDFSERVETTMKQNLIDIRSAINYSKINILTIKIFVWLWNYCRFIASL